MSDLLWKEHFTNDEWNTLLAENGGHPLQSMEWGKAKNIKQHTWIAYYKNKPVLMARFEEKKILKFFKVAWVPRGPIYLDNEYKIKYLNQFFSRLRKNNFIICITNPYENSSQESSANFLTALIDLTLPLEKLFMNLQKQFRYDVRRAKKLGILIEISSSMQDLQEFIKICEKISKQKNFSLGASKEIMTSLFSQPPSKYFAPILFVAKHENIICGGAFIIRCGNNLHYIWGGVDRQFAHLSIGESLQWNIIEWGVNNNYKIYDLEGISNTNSGVDKFKKKIGGVMVAHCGIEIHPLVPGAIMIKPLLKYIFRWYQHLSLRFLQT